MANKMNNMVGGVEASVQEIAKANRNAIEQVALLKMLIGELEKENAKISSALQDVADKLLKIQTESAETENKKRPSKLWHITLSYHGVVKELWLARDIYVALGGRYNDVQGFFDMVDGCTRGECIQVPRSTVKVCGCPEYNGDSMSYWMDEAAVDSATEWMATHNQHRHKTPNRTYDADAIIQRYAEVHNGEKVAEEFNLTPSAVSKILRRHGVETPGFGHRRKVTQEMEADIIRLSTDGLSQPKIARIVGISQNLVSKVLRRNGIGKGLDR